MTAGAIISEQQSGLRDYLVALRRRWRWLAGAIVVAVGIAAAVSYLTTPLYKSTAQLTFVRQPDITSALGGTTLGVSTVEVQRESETYVQLMTTDEMGARAVEQLGRSIPEDVSIEAEYVPDTSVLRIGAVSDDPSEARDVANAYADGFTQWRRQVTIDQYRQAEEIVVKKLRGYGTDEAALRDPGYVQLQGRLQDIRVLEAAATGNFIVASAGALPTAPFVPQHVRDLMLGLIIGLVAGIGIVALVEQLDVRVHSVEELGTVLGLPILARLPRPSREEGKNHSLAVAGDPSGPSAEAFRMLRGNLEFVAVDGELSSILFTSAEQGEGKTTTVGNLALMLARAGKRVIVVDCDLRRPRLHTYFGLPNNTGVSTLVTGHGSITETVQTVAVPTAGERLAGVDKVEGCEWIAVLTAGPVPPNPGEIVASQRLRDLLGMVSTDCDLLLVDCPPFLAVGDAAALARSVSGVIIVSRMGVASKTLMQETRHFVERLPSRALGVVATNVGGEDGAYRHRYQSDDASALDAVEEIPQTPEPLAKA